MRCGTWENLTTSGPVESRLSRTDMVIIGAGPVGLFTVFASVLPSMKCQVIGSLPKIGGQCAEFYPDKPIYDIPAVPDRS